MGGPPSGTATSRKGVARLQARLRACFDGPAAPEALRNALREIGVYFAAVHVVVRLVLDGREHAQDWSWEGFAGIGGIQVAAADLLYRVHRSGTARAEPIEHSVPSGPLLLAVPVLDSQGEVLGAAAAVVESRDPDPTAETLTEFEGLLGYVTLLLGRAPRSTQSTPVRTATPAVPPDPLRLAQTITRSLQRHAEVAQVLVGEVVRDTVRITAVAGSSDFRSANPGLRLARAAMEECLDHGEPIGVDDAGWRLHGQWQQSLGGDHVASLPLRVGDEIVAVVSLRTHTRLDDGAVAAIRAELEGFAPWIPVVARAERGLITHAAQSMAGFLHDYFGLARPMRLLRNALLVGAAAFVAFGTLPYGFTVPCTVEPAEERIIACPRDGVLAESRVQPGDVVRAGDVLARLSTEEIELERAAVDAEEHRLRAEMDQARAEGRPADARVLAARLAVVGADRALAEHRAGCSEIRATCDGRILTGDLRSRVGAAVTRGESFFRIADSRMVRLELQVPERHAYLIHERTGASFAPLARPTDRIGLGAIVVHPSGEVVGGRNVFRARSVAISAPPQLTPGMEGVVHVEAGDRPVWWLLSHRVLDWLRLEFYL